MIVRMVTVGSDEDVDDDVEWEAPCPRCGEPARHGCVERLEGGSINVYWPVDCDSCHLHQGYWH